MNVSSGYMKNGFDAYGDKILRKEDMGYWMDRPKRTDPDGVTLGLGEEVELVEDGFFELLPTINEIWMENPECKIVLDEKTIRLFKDNKVLFRGVYDSNAEKMARELKLRFLHSDVRLVSIGDYFERGSDVITLRFEADGRVFIHEDCMTQGISAGSTGGGEYSFDLPKDFYLNMSAEEIAEKCWPRVSGEIVNNGKLDSFMKKIKDKKGYLLDFSDN